MWRARVTSHTSLDNGKSKVGKNESEHFINQQSKQSCTTRRIDRATSLSHCDHHPFDLPLCSWHLGLRAGCCAMMDTTEPQIGTLGGMQWLLIRVAWAAVYG